MRELLSALDISLERLRGELDLHDVIAKAVESRFETNDLALRSSMQLANLMFYKTAIIGSYGLLEETVDSVLMACAETLNRIYVNQSDIPERVRDQHRVLILRSLMDGDRSRMRDQVQERTALDALVCKQEGPSQLVSAVFTMATQNYRYPYTLELFSRLGLAMGEVAERFRTWDKRESLGFSSLSSFLEDLVIRRNILAHSYEVAETLNLEMIRVYVEGVEFYLHSLIKVAQSALAAIVVETRLKLLGSVVKVWEGRIGIDLRSASISKGDRIVLNRKNQFWISSVNSLQSESREEDSFSAGEAGLNVAAAISLETLRMKGAKVYSVDESLRDLLEQGLCE